MSSLRTRILGLTIAMAFLVFAAPRAHAVGEAPTVDGNLADLIAAVNANLGSDKGGFAFVDPASDVFTGACAYINGYDIVKSYAYFRLKDATGAYTPSNVTLYLGWEVTGNIGDVDGDGNPDTFDPTGPGAGCALSDGGGNVGCASGIGVGESYSILLNLNCSGADDLRLGVSNNKVGILTAGGDLSSEIAGAVFCRSGHFLELSIPHYETLLKAPPLVIIGATLCQANLRMVANAGDDLLAEDTTPVQQLRIPGSIAITKTPASQDACPGTNVSWNIQVCNNGICPFSTVTVTDTLDAGLTYFSDDRGSVQGPNPHIRVWTFSNLNPGDCQTISLTAKVDAPCAAAVLNNNVGVEAVEPASPCSQFPEGASAHASAQVNCKQPDVNIIKQVGPSPINPGQTTTVTLTIQNTGNSVLDPIHVCDKIDAGVSFDAAQAIGGSCGVSLLTNTLNGDGTRTICFTPFSLAVGASCTISYRVGCVTSGVHPDTATVTAFCKGDSQNPIRDRDQSSFTCACPADVEIGKSVNPPTVNPGEDVTVTLTISNPGSTVLDPINVCDKLDAGVGFDATQVIGGTCGVTLASNTLNGDGTRTICFTPLSLAPGTSCTIVYKVTCVTSGAHPDTATVIGQCKGGGDQDRDRDQSAASFRCESAPCVVSSTIKSNFNGTSIVGVGNKPAYVWFNSNFTVKGGTITPGTQIHLRQSVVVINGTSYDVPDANITFQAVSCASTSFDPLTKTWNTTVPLAGSDEIFLTGLVLPLLSLQGGATVSWSGSFETDQPGICVSWKWGAAVYKSWPLRSADPFDVDYNAANIKPTHSAACGISNGDHAGTPQNPIVRGNVTGGARGGGGSNFTGSWSGTSSVCLACPPAQGVSYERGGGSRDLRTMGQGADATTAVELYRPVPNPFQNSTTVAYAIGGAGQTVSIGIYDVAGRLIRNLASGFQPAGRYLVVWDGRSADGSTVAGGVYFLRAYVGGQRMAEDATRILYLR